MIDWTVATYGRLDVALNNAGIQTPQRPMAEITDDEFDRTVAQFSIFNYLSMFTNRPAIETKIEIELTHNVVLFPISEFLAFVSFGVT